jgi:hypothetical protein
MSNASHMPQVLKRFAFLYRATGTWYNESQISKAEQQIAVSLAKRHQLMPANNSSSDSSSNVNTSGIHLILVVLQMSIVKL